MISHSLYSGERGIHILNLWLLAHGKGGPGHAGSFSSWAAENTCSAVFTPTSRPSRRTLHRKTSRSRPPQLRTLHKTQGQSSSAPSLPPATQSIRASKPSSRSDARYFHSTVARTTFSLMFEESSVMFFVLMLQGLNVFSPRTRQMSCQFSLMFLMAIILVGVPLCISLILALRVPLPPALSNADLFTASLARLIVLGIVILGLLSGFGAISNSWNLIPGLSPTRGEPTEQDVSTAEYTLQSVRNDLRTRCAAAERRASSQAAAADNSSWLSRLTPNFRGADGLSQELRGLEALEEQMSRNVEALRARRDSTALYSRTLHGRIFNAGARIFVLYCVLRIASCLINVLVPSRRTSSQSQTDLIADLLARILAPGHSSGSHLDRDAIACPARQLSLVLVGLIILTSVRRVLKGATRALRVTSRNIGASLMMLILAQLMGMYLLSTVVQLRNSFRPPAPDDDAEANLFSTIPSFEVFGALFDWAFLLAAGASAFVRWGHERVNGVEDF
ncbi:hypothetical protein D9615_007881 [Tricholomella constricta]|uniref:Abscisic acid G-protein coupled receptor-domain-containing protein n=1 Tax=Tricholomella constricta TaxID=117010 RepID=A0A8H5H4D4_9AGAR|nr:hypothetical protein D9615_007881 [Tricholomella constricta]